MILKINSKNNHLLDILFKNPNTDKGLYLKALKNGYIIGNTIDTHNYEVVFQDTKYSYLPEDSNQIDYQSYCSPLTVLHICNELFPHILKAKEDFQAKDITWLNITQGEADTEECTIEIPSFYIDSSWYRNGCFLLSKYFDGINLQQQSKRIFKLMIIAKSIFEAFNLLSLTSLFAHITNDYGMFTYIDDGLAQKYTRVLTNIDNVPYFVFYLFIMRAVKSEKQFKDLKPVFENYLAKSGLEADLVLHGIHQQRVRFITEQLDLDMPILDIGCGEFTYYKKMMQKGFIAPYYAVDEDAKFERLAENIARRYDEDNLNFYTSLEDFTLNEQVNVLLTEVIEHNPLEDAKNLIKKALSYNFNKLIITTPNSEFNQYYTMDEDMRHDDHHFEPTQAEFKAIIAECIQNEEIEVDYFQLGDKLNGVQPTQGCVITK